MIEIDQQLVYDISQKYPDPEALFQLLPEDIQRHSLRVADYTQILYQAAIDVELEPFSEEAAKERDPMFNYYMYLSGKYHDIGIMCLPENSKSRSEGVLAPQISDDEAHVLYGSALTENYRRANGYEPKMFWTLMAEALRSHHENPDGTGFPDKLTFNQTPLSAWLVSLADKLDNLTAYTHTETPFKDGFNDSLNFVMENNLNELELVLRVCEAKLEKAFLSHARETDIITYKPLTIKRNARRPMYLNFRKVTDIERRGTVAFQARALFHMRGAKSEELLFDELQDKLREAKAIPTVWRYLLYEASDMRERMDAYGYRAMALQVPVFQGALSTAKSKEIIDKWIEEVEPDLSSYVFMVDAGMMKRPPKTLITRLKELQENGAKLMYTGFTGAEKLLPEIDEVTGETLIAPEIKYDLVQLDPVIYDRMDEEIKGSIKALRKAGMELQADGVESDDYNELLASLKVSTVCGDYAGEYRTDNEILTDCNDPRRILKK